MDSPKCFSQYFVNRQHIRFSFVTKMLKCKRNRTLPQIILEDKNLASGLSQEFIMLLIELRRNVKSKANKDYLDVFSKPSKMSKNLLPVEKDFIFNNCWQTLIQIIPKRLYGNSHNVKILRKLIQTVIYSMKGEHILLSKVLEHWQFYVGLWNNIPSETSKILLHHVVTWIIINILSPMICLNFYVTTCKVDSDELKLIYFWRHEWQCFYDKVLNRMIKSNVLNKKEPLSFGRKLKKKISKAERLRNKSLSKNIPHLILLLKANGDCRPIVRYKCQSKNLTEKRIVKEKLDYLRLLSGSKPVRLDRKYLNIYNQWISLDKPKLYFIKADLTNAFGSVDNEKLMEIIARKHSDLQEISTDSFTKKKQMQLYKEIIFELQKPLYIRAGSTIYEWKKGLVQGYKYSPALSEIYYSNMDEIYFSGLYKDFKTIDLLIRVVDDYLYVTDDLYNAHNFIKALQNYNNLNLTKTVANFAHSDIKYSEEITFLGYMYNTNNMEVSRAKNVFTGPMCYKIAFTNAMSNNFKFLENRIGQSSIKIDSHLFNLHYNSEIVIWNHIYSTFLLSANKFCTVLSILCKKEEMSQYLSLYKKKVTVKLGNRILSTILNNKPEGYLFVYCINHFRYLSWKALLLSAQKSVYCNNLVPKITVELSKCDCLFGKWREHSSRIDLEGNMKALAVREVCTRLDLRKAFKLLDISFKDMQFYNNKSRNLLL